MNDSHDIAKPPPVETETHHSPLNPLKWSADCDKSDATSVGLVSGSGHEEQQQLTSLLHTGVCSPERTPPVSGTLKRPLASMAASGTPRRVSSRLSMPGSPADAPASSPSGSCGSSPDRKIWMRACNGCGHELHVRRTKCTECGSLQSSKRAIATAKEEAERAATAACAASQLREEAEAAASQLTRIIAAAAPAEAIDADACATGPAPSSSAEGEVRAASAVSAKAAAAAARAKAFTETVARLSPDQLLKLRRMRKLRALLAKVPADAKPRAAVPVANPADDAISMLASVACSS